MKFALVVYLAIEGTSVPWFHSMELFVTAAQCREAKETTTRRLEARYRGVQAACVSLPVRLIPA